jgi:transposase
LAHGEQPNRQYNLPESGKNIASKAKWDGIAERVADPAVQKSLAVDLALSTDDDQLLPERDLAIVNNAKPNDANTFYRLRSGPGVGKILALGMRHEIHAIHRFPRGQDVVSYGRLVTCAKASAGQRAGTSGKHSGHASLKWAFSEAAVRFRRHNPAGQKFLATLGYRHGKGKALTVLAHKLARAVYGLLKRQTVFDRETFLPR